MARTKKTVEDNTVKSVYTEHEIEWNGEKITVKNLLRPGDAYAIIHTVSEKAFGKDGAYQPEVSSFVWTSLIISAFSDYKLPEDSDDLFAVCFGTDLYSCILNAISGLDQIEWMQDAIEKRIAFAADRREADVKNKLDELSIAASELAKKMEEIFGGISSEDVNAMVRAMSDGKLNEDKLVEAYMKHSK